MDTSVREKAGETPFDPPLKKGGRGVLFAKGGEKMGNDQITGERTSVSSLPVGICAQTGLPALIPEEP